MDISLEYIVIVVLVLLTGLAAGLCFTWSNAVTPGIGRLDDLSFLKAFQEMNRAILNPTFFIVFFGPFFLSIINIYVFKNASSSIVWMLVAGAIIYFVGLVLVTIFGNVPLNEVMDATDLVSATAEDLKELRDNFETRWNRLHLIRTISAVISLLLFIISLTQLSKNTL